MENFDKLSKEHDQLLHILDISNGNFNDFYFITEYCN